MQPKRNERRTGCYGLQVEIPFGPNYIDEAQDLVEQLSQFLQARLVQSASDGRSYHALAELKVTTSVEPEQAQVGEYVLKDALYKHQDVFDEDAIGHLLPTSGFVFDKEIRIFSEEKPGLWKRIK